MATSAPPRSRRDRDRDHRDWDVVVVGAGSAGCALAGRLTEDPGLRVLVLEAGAAPTDPGAFAPEVRQVSTLAGADPGGPHTWAFTSRLTDGPGPEGRTATVARGRVLGGSSAVNGANHLRATPADVATWPGWSYDRAVAYYVRGEHDHDVGGEHHGRAGPVPVRRPAGELLAPVTPRFLDAAARLGVRAEPDKNAGGPPGAGLVPANVADGVRVNAAMAYLLPHLDRANLAVRGGTAVVEVLFDGDRAVGVRTADGASVAAGEVVLAAGSVKTPHLLALSGIGPADALRAAGIAVRLDAPGVGHGFTDHPSVFLALPPGDDGPLHPDAASAQAAVHLDAAALDPTVPGGSDPAGDLEVLLFARPFTPGGARHLMVALQAPRSRGSMTPVSADPGAAPRIAHHYLADAADRARMRAGVRFAGELLRAGGLVAAGADTPGTPDDPAGLDDPGLDAWVAAHLTTSSHLCGSARAGGADVPGAVVDPQLWVHGVAGLRVVDTSVVPVPRRGPAATALMLGEWAADRTNRTARPEPGRRRSRMGDDPSSGAR